MSSPVFPPELELLVFSDALALITGEESALDLFLVAKRVHTWLIPQYMRTLAIQLACDQTRYHRRCTVSMLEKYGFHTRNLFIWIDDSEPSTDVLNTSFTPEKYLSCCPNVVNLVLWIEITDAEMGWLSRLPLTHLSVNLNYIIDYRAKVGEEKNDNDNEEERGGGNETIKVQLSHLLSQITHLEITHRVTSQTDFIDLQLEFKSLTHLILPISMEGESLYGVLERFPTLEVVLLEIEAVKKVVDRVDDDDRVVRIQCREEDAMEDWLLDLEGGLGVWGLGNSTGRGTKETDGL